MGWHVMDLFYTKFMIILNQHVYERLGSDRNECMQNVATINFTLSQSQWGPMVTLLENANAILYLKNSPKSADQLELNKCQAVHSIMFSRSV